LTLIFIEILEMT